MSILRRFKASLIQFFKTKYHILLGILIFALALGGIAFSYVYFTITTIEIITPSQELHGVESWKKKNLFLITEEGVQKQLLKANPQLRAVDVTKKYPQTLVIAVEYRRPIAVVRVSDGFLSVDKTGVVIEKNKLTDGNLPIIKYYQNLLYNNFQPGDVLEPKDLQAALHFLDLGAEIGLTINSIDIVSFYMLGLYSDGAVIYVSPDKDLSVQDYQLSAIVRQLKIEGKKFKSLDLRFDKPIVVF